MARQMKDSGIAWIGEIPAEWSKDKVFRLFKIVGSGTTPKSTDDSLFDGNIHWIQSGDINGTVLADSKASISEEAMSKFSALKLYSAPFLIVAMYGASIGNMSLSQIDGCVNQACCVMQDGTQYLQYSFYAIKAAKEYLIRKAVGGGQPNISQDTIKQLWLPMPPSEEQRRIADFLDAECARIDAVIEKTRASIEEYKKLKQSVITEAVTKGIRPGRKMKDSGIEWIGEIPDEWTVIKLKYLFYIIGGNGFPDDLQGKTDGDYPFCKVSDINGVGDYVDTAANWVTQAVVEENKFNIIPSYSIIMAKIGAALAKNHRKLNRIECCIDNNTQALVPKRADCIRFLLYLCKCIDMKWFDNNSTVPSINNQKLLTFFVPNVPLDEQEEIANYLDQKCAGIDALALQKEKSLLELESYKKSLIFEYVTGKKEVV